MVETIKKTMSKLSGNRQEQIQFKTQTEVGNPRALEMLKKMHGIGPFPVKKRLGNTKVQAVDDFGKPAIFSWYWVKPA